MRFQGGDAIALLFCLLREIRSNLERLEHRVLTGLNDLLV